MRSAPPVLPGHREERQGTGRRWLARWAPLCSAGAVVIFNLCQLVAESRPVAMVNDASVHEEMVRFAARRIAQGDLPFTSWFPYIGLGSAQYLHYQSLGSVLTGLAADITGTSANSAFDWSTYLLVACWPLVLYGASRLFGYSRPASATAAVLAPFMVSYTGVGYERGAYLWVGGAQVWTQLLGSWALPLAWAFTWRAFQRPRCAWPACALVGLTVAFHFMSGYLAFVAIVVMALLSRGRLAWRLAHGFLLMAGSFLAAAWVVVPLLLFSNWSSVNQELAGTSYVRGYGARTELGWLVTGDVFDARRAVPVISVAVLAGAVIAVARWRRDPLRRTMLALFVASLLISFGGTTWGALADLVPAHADLYFRRFLMGSQLAGILMAGDGAVSAWAIARPLLRTLVASPMARNGARALLALAAVAWCWPAGHQIWAYDRRDSTAIEVQEQADISAGAQIAPLLHYIKAHGQGRVYAGQGMNWGQSFTVGYVPVYKYLEGKDIDEVTYVVPSLSLMLDPEAAFDEDNLADYGLFAAKYILLPVGMSPPVPATLLLASGAYALWSPTSGSYGEAVRAQGVITADRSDIGSRSLAFLAVVGPGQDSAVNYPGLPPPFEPPFQVLGRGAPAPGAVKALDADLVDGRMALTVDMDHPGTLLVSVAYDPGWLATANGRPVSTQMMAPALVGVPLPAGRYTVILQYHGFSWYPELWALGVVGLVAVAYGERAVRRWLRCSAAGG